LIDGFSDFSRFVAEPLHESEFVDAECNSDSGYWSMHYYLIPKT